MKKGISLISLIITIIVMIILASITIFSSFNTVGESQDLKKKTEFNDVSTFVQEIGAKASAGLINLDLIEVASSTDSTKIHIATTDEISELVPAEDQMNVSSANTSDRSANRKYYYVTGKEIQSGSILGVTIDSEGNSINDIEKSFTIPKKVENNYIINFYYGTVATKISDDITLIHGQVK